jgi:hypothetical protein
VKQALGLAINVARRGFSYFGITTTDVSPPGRLLNPPVAVEDLEGTATGLTARNGGFRAIFFYSCKRTSRVFTPLNASFLLNYQVGVNQKYQLARYVNILHTINPHFLPMLGIW